MVPLVAIPGHHSPVAEGFRTPVVGAGRSYLDALARAGATPVVVPPLAELADRLPELLARVDALLLLGGGDVDPARYGATDRHPRLYDVQPDVDAFELAALDAALAAELPVLAICRGAQLLNVACGGTLHQHIGDLPSTAPVSLSRSHRAVLHDVDVVAGTRTAALLDTDRTPVYSRHHQAIDRVGAGLTVAARSDDGIVEAVELDRGWVVGLQWHPEDTAATDPVQQRVFDGFCARAREGPPADRRPLTDPLRLR